jgi:hypothetical protein
MIIFVDTIGTASSPGALRATTGNSATRAAIAGGFWSMGDGGGGVFCWDQSSIAADDGGTIINPTGHGRSGRWIRIREEALSVRWFGATGDGLTDDTMAIQRAISAAMAGTGGGRVVRFPAGTYCVCTSLTIQNATGITLEGVAGLAAALIPAAALSGSPVVLLVNCLDCAVRDLWIQGNTSSPPSAGIESRADHPGSPQQYPTNLLVRDVTIGNPAYGITEVGLAYGIRFTATANSDGANDKSTVSRVTLAGLGVAGISIEHSNSFVHKFDNLRIYDVPVGIQTKGGSYQLVNSFLSVTNLEFDFLAPQGTFQGKTSAGYYHPILISNTSSEGSGDLLRAAAWPSAGTPRTDGISGIHIYISNFDQTGRNGSVAINYQSPGKLSISNSHLNFGKDTNIVANNPKSVITLTGNYFCAVHQIQFAGHLTSVGNYYYGGTSEFVPTSGAVTIGDFNKIGDLNDFPNSTN